MHTYSCDKRSYKTTLAILFAMSICLTYICHLIFAKLNITLPWYAESPSVFGFYSVLIWVYDSWLWKIKICRIRLSSIPDYSGTWKGYIISSYDKAKRYDCCVVITQTWKELSCKLTTKTSTSYSSAASVKVEIGPTEGLTWLYCNTPNNSADESMHIHYGVSHATISPDGTMHCEYFNCARDRSTYGTITLKKV